MGAPPQTKTSKASALMLVAIGLGVLIAGIVLAVQTKTTDAGTAGALRRQNRATQAGFQALHRRPCLLPVAGAADAPRPA